MTRPRKGKSQGGEFPGARKKRGTGKCVHRALLEPENESSGQQYLQNATKEKRNNKNSGHCYEGQKRFVENTRGRDQGSRREGRIGTWSLFRGCMKEIQKKSE